MRSLMLAAMLLVSSATFAAAPKAGPGSVWVNSDTKTYHCYGSQFYGNTKTGSYMAEKDAKASGNKPAGDKVCGAT